MRGFTSEDRPKSKAEHKPVTIEDVLAVHETERALCCKINGLEHWIPKSAIHDDSEVFDAREHNEGKLVVPYWFAKVRGFAE